MGKAVYDNLLQDFLVFFEGFKEPIFYHHFYPMGRNQTEEEWAQFRFSQGLKIGDTKEKQERNDRYYCEYRELYVQSLKLLFNAVMRDYPKVCRGALVIPSSTKGVINKATGLTREVLRSNPRPFDDLTAALIRTDSKQKAHQGGDRSSKGTLEVSIEIELKDYDVLVVIDDIVTTGTSFTEVDDLLREAGFKGRIINFAFAKTYPSEGVELNIAKTRTACGNPYDPERRRELAKSGFQVTLEDQSMPVFSTNYEIVKQAKYEKRLNTDGKTSIFFDSTIILQFDDQCVEFSDFDDVRTNLKHIKYVPPVEAVVFDLDQTLIDDPVRFDFDTERFMLSKASRGERGPYNVYEGVEEFFAKGIPFAIVSNRGARGIALLLQAEHINRAIYPEYRKSTVGIDLCNEERARLKLYYGCDEAPSTITLVPANSFSFPVVVEKDGFEAKLYKPTPYGVNDALSWLYFNVPGLDEDSRIVGIGNTIEDIIAYEEAGIESALALWGVPEGIREFARNNWGADYAFESMAEFTDWCLQ